jgi:plasmid stability protein
MPVTLSIKNVPDDLAQRLRDRAARHHRSLQGELLTIIEAAARPTTSVADFWRVVDELGIRIPSESARVVPEGRDDPHR